MMMLLDLLGSKLAPIKIKSQVGKGCIVLSSPRDGMNATSGMMKNGVVIVKRRG
jgi:hypothetical protein